jgi:molybdenum cofactor synthesis domain-containing protein
MCDSGESNSRNKSGTRTVPVKESVGMVIPHDITEIRPGEFKGRAFKKGHVVTEDDIGHLQKLGKENLYVLDIQEDEMHEDEAAHALAEALAGEGIQPKGEPKEGKIDLVAAIGGLLKVHNEALVRFNMLGEVMCATMHNNSVVSKGQTVAGTRAIPLVINRSVVKSAVEIAENAYGILNVKEMRRPRAGIVITGNEVYHGRIKDSFQAVITEKIRALGGDVVRVYFAPDDAGFIEQRIRELLEEGADLIVTTGGMSVDPDDVTRFAVRNLGAEDITYGSPVLPGAMFLVAYYDIENSKFEFRNSNLKHIPILGIPACGMYCDITIFDIILPRVLAGEKIGRRELAELGHGGLCLKCDTCRYPVCPFGKC